MKVVITGPESTGKTTLAQALAQHYQINYVKEYARKFLLDKQGKYVEADLLTIAKGQIIIEDELLEQNPKLVICDTSLEVIRVWSEWKYDRCDPFIIEQAKLREPELFLLLKPDFSWQPDPLRENPDDRDVLFNSYHNAFNDYTSEIVIISGDSEIRISTAINAIDNFSI